MAGSANEQFIRDVCVDYRMQELTLDTDEDELGGALTDSSASEMEVDSKWISGRRQYVAQPLPTDLASLAWPDSFFSFSLATRDYDLAT